MKRLRLIMTIVLSSLILTTGFSAYADIPTEDERKNIEIRSNKTPNWPEGPTVSAKSAIVMEASTGVILYEKNIHERMYPASTTKLMTTLVAMEKENVSLNDLVSFSEKAVMSIPPDASNMGMDIGEKMTLEECLYGILVVSANEVSNAVAEYVAGDIDSFVDLMNQKAKELNCNETHFNNPHGYTDPDHYTTAYDLALISREFSENELLSKISRTPNYHWYPTEYQPDEFTLGSTNFFMRGIYELDGLIASKTGYTDESGQVLTTVAERNGMRLICVVMMEETPAQYEDTISLLEYGFDNFELLNIAEHETKYTVTDDNFFHSDHDILGSSKGIIFMDESANVVLPKTTEFEDINSKIVYNDPDVPGNSDSFARIVYDYNRVYLGSADLLLKKEESNSLVFEDELPGENEESDQPIIIYIDLIIYIAIGIFALILIITFIKRRIKANHLVERRKARNRWKKRRKIKFKIKK